VVSPGGARRPPVAGRAAFAVLEASARGELGPVVATCPGCDQPMVADGAAPAAEYEVALPNGLSLRFLDGRVFGSDGEISWDDARARVDKALPKVAEAGTPGLGPFQGLLILAMLTPFAVWVFAVVFVTVFLYKFEPLP
jgi:hypothetical protein